MTEFEPAGFSWVDRPRLAALARPYAPEDLVWLRREGVQLLISLTEVPVRRDWLDAAGLLALHLPVEDMQPPTPEQLETCVSAIRRAKDQGMGVAVHCAAGLGRTGTVLAAYLVAEGFTAHAAIERVRELRPGSIETVSQENAVYEYARRLRPEIADE